MASISVDAELMTNYVSATPLNASSLFMSVLDAKRRPVVFCLSTGSEPVLRILRRDSSGRSELLDLNAVVGIPAGAIIQTFHIKQSWSLSLYMCIAYADKGNTTQSRLLVLKPFQASDITKDARLPAFTGEVDQLSRVEKIYMSPVGKSETSLFPDIYLVYKPFDKLKNTTWGSDIRNIRVDPQTLIWKTNDAFAAPLNLTAVLDLAPARGIHGKGLYVLYHDSLGKSRLYAQFFDRNYIPGEPDRVFTTAVQCPEDATAIGSFLDEDGDSSLLIASSAGLHLLSPLENVSKDAPGKLVFPDKVFLKGVRALQVTQDKDAVSIWFDTDRGELGYIRTQDHNFEGGIPALLQSEGSINSFSSCVVAATTETGNVSRQLLVANSNGRLSLMEQSSDIGLWKTTPFFAPSSTESTPLRSYTVTLKAKLPNGQSAKNASFFVSASSTVSALVNGNNVLLSIEPRWFPSDAQGSLDFIIPTDSLSSPIIQIDALRDEGRQKLAFQPVRFDPVAKVMDNMVKKLSEIKSAKDFSDAKTADGKKLFSDSSPSMDDLEAARSQLATAGKAYAALSTASSSSVAQSESKDPPPRAMSEIGATSVTTESFMDGWNYLKEKVRDVTDWIIQKAGQVWEFVCKIGNQIKKFVMDCVEKICEAASWIWQKLKVAWEKLRDWIGFIFNWQDILDTKNTISSVLTSSFGYAAVKVKGATVKVDQVCDQIIANIDQWGNAAPQKDIGCKEANGADSGGKINEAQTSTSCTWASERLKNGGSGTSVKMEQPGESNDALSVWNNIVVPEMKAIGEQLLAVGKEALTLFQDGGKITAYQLINVGKTALKAGVNSVRKIIKALIELVATLLIKFQTLGNKPINIPIFTWLYKQISGGHDLTLFDAVSLVIAVPTTIFAKLITGKAPPKIPNLNAELLGNILDDDKSVSQTVKSDFEILKAEMVVGITITTGAFAVLKLIYKAFTGGRESTIDELNESPEGFFDVFGIVVDLISTIIALPDGDDMPGAELRRWVSFVSSARGIYHIIFFFVPSNDITDAAVLCLDLVTTLANLGLNIAIFVAEKDAAATWEDYNEDTSEQTMVANALNTVAGIAYFAAFMFKKSQPHVSAIGSAVMIGTVAGAAVLEGVMFKQQYDEKRRIAITAAPGF